MVVDGGGGAARAAGQADASVVHQLREERDHLAADRDVLRVRLEEMRRHCETLAGEQLVLRGTVEEMEAVAQETEARCRDLAAERDDLRTRWSDAVSACEELRRERDVLIGERDALSVAHRGVMAGAVWKGHDRAASENASGSRDESVDLLGSSDDDDDATINGADDAVDVALLEARLEALALKHAQTEAERDGLAVRVSELEDHLARVALSGERSDLAARLEAAEAEKEALRRRAEEAVAEREAVERERGGDDHPTALIASLRAERDALAAERDTMLALAAPAAGVSGDGGGEAVAEVVQLRRERDELSRALTSAFSAGL